MNNLLVFTDASANPKKDIGIGAYYVANISILDIKPEEVNSRAVAKSLHFFEFEDTSSTKLEVQTAIASLNHLISELKSIDTYHIILITDSQCVAELPERREKLEKKNFVSSATNEPHQHTELYKEFYELMDRLHFEVQRVPGHLKSNEKETINVIFSIIDKEVRHKLREEY